MNTERPLTPAEAAFAGEADDELTARLAEAARQTPAQRRADADRLLDDQLGIDRPPSPEERLQAVEQRATLAERRLHALAREQGYSDVAEMLTDFEITDDDGDDQ